MIPVAPAVRSPAEGHVDDPCREPADIAEPVADDGEREGRTPPQEQDPCDAEIAPDEQDRDDHQVGDVRERARDQTGGATMESAWLFPDPGEAGGTGGHRAAPLVRGRGRSDAPPVPPCAPA